MVLAVTFDQSEFEIRCEWARNGLETLAPISDVVVIVDVLSFSTAVDVALGRGGIVLPFPVKGDSAASYAASTGAVLASDRGSGFSLSPASLQAIPSGLKLVLPSPNGAALCYSAANATVITACLRNATASADAAMRLGRTFAVVPAGETWDDSSLRPSIEDLLGAGAVISALRGRRSPEACAATAVFESFRSRLHDALRACSSGKELIERGFDADVDVAAELDTSSSVARLVGREIRSML
jgi:2-phosphosulfolactate phosphatase